MAANRDPRMDTITFPSSRTCLWNDNPTDDPLQLHLTRSGWLQIRLSSNVVKLAVHHASDQTCDQEAWLMATPIVNEDHQVLIEVNRFDPGKWVKIKGRVQLCPTTILPGDVSIHCKVVKNKSHFGGYLSHNLVTLQEAFSDISDRLSSSTVCQFLTLLSLRIILFSQNGTVLLHCGCVLPSSTLVATPITSIPLLPTALTRNLTGTLPISSLQGRIRTGYLTMDKCRKLVPLLSTDSHTHSLPVVGIWLSGVSIYHPAVWSTVLHYIHTSLQLDRVYQKEKFLLLITGRDYHIWQCELPSLSWEWHVVNTPPIQINDSFISCQLMPIVEGMAGHTLLLSACQQWQQNGCHDDSLPLPMLSITPSKAPQSISRDRELSCVSLLTPTDHDNYHDNKMSSQLEQQQQLLALQEQVRQLLAERTTIGQKTTPTVTIGTNTGNSLLLNTSNVSVGGASSVLSEDNNVISKDSVNSTKTTPTYKEGSTISLPQSLPTMSSVVSMATETVVDLSSPNYSLDESLISGTSDVFDKEQEQALYQQLKKQVEEFLNQNQPYKPCPHRPTPVTTPTTMDTSMLPIPKIQHSVLDYTSTSVDMTLDAHANMADLISQQYVTPTQLVTTATTLDDKVDYSMATCHYLQRHGLLNEKQSEPVLDVNRLKQLPKLL